MSEFRVQKERAEAILTLSNGACVRGNAFVSAFGPTQTGRERIKDVLNTEDGFFPFEVDQFPFDADQCGTPRTVLFHRDHVVVVTLPGGEEPRQDPGYEVASRHAVSLLLANGTRLTGYVRVYSPPGHERLSDYARTGEQFRYLETPEATLIVNTRYVLALTEVRES